MKRMILLTVTLFIAVTMYGVNATIKEINQNPEKFKGELVVVDGLVSKWVPGSQNSTSHYLFEDEYGFTVRVNTASKPPETKVRYRISGILYFDSVTNDLFISEQGRAKIAVVDDGGKTNGSGKGITILVVLIILIGVFSYFSYKILYKKKVATGKTPDKAPLIEKPMGSDEDFKTIKLSAAEPPKTLKFMPGELKIISGSDKGKVLKIAGYPTPEGNVVTIGREDVIGDRGFAHIRLIDSTISRKQAEIIQTGKTMMVKNISKTNLTVVDGVVLQPDQKVEIKPNSTIKTGDVEFQYIV